MIYILTLSDVYTHLDADLIKFQFSLLFLLKEQRCSPKTVRVKRSADDHRRVLETGAIQFWAAAAAVIERRDLISLSSHSLLARNQVVIARLGLTVCL